VQAPSVIGFKEKVDRAVGTDFARKLLSPNDWFYSALNRRLLKEYFFKQGVSMKDQDIKFHEYDVGKLFRKVIDPISGPENRENGFERDFGTSAANFKRDDMMSS
jgi:hypothetical protein